MDATHVSAPCHVTCNIFDLTQKNFAKNLHFGGTDLLYKCKL